MPKLDDEARKRPLSYNRERDKFIYFDEVVSGKENLIPLDRLSPAELKRLVIERWRVLAADTTIQSISGPPYMRDDVIRAIEKDEPFGQMTVEMERNYLREFLAEIERNLPDNQ